MKPQSFLFHVPGASSFYNYAELKAMDSPPITLEVRDCKANASLGKMNILDILEKFSQ